MYCLLSYNRLERYIFTSHIIHGSVLFQFVNVFEPESFLFIYQRNTHIWHMCLRKLNVEFCGNLIAKLNSISEFRRFIIR